MGVLKFLAWTTCCVGLGVFLAKGEVNGRTPLEHMERTWKRNVRPTGQVDRQVDRLKDGLKDALDDAKDAVSSKTDSAPRERITPEDRAAVNRIIAQKK
jgi:hypothetical protein